MRCSFISLAQLCCCIFTTEVALNFRIKTSVAKPPFGEYKGVSNLKNALWIFTAAEGGIRTFLFDNNDDLAAISKLWLKASTSIGLFALDHPKDAAAPLNDLQAKKIALKKIIPLLPPGIRGPVIHQPICECSCS